MARLFDAASKQYLYTSSNPTTYTGTTWSVWFYTDSSTKTLLWRGPAGDQRISVGAFSSRFRIFRADGGLGTSCTTLNSYVSDAWNHGCALLTSTSNVTSILNGDIAQKGSSGAPHSPNSTNSFYIGGWSSDLYGRWTGRIAEVATWSTILADDEVSMLAKGLSPLVIRPDELTAYWPLVQDDDIDVLGAHSLTAVASPTTADHPPIYHASHQMISLEATPVAALRYPRGGIFMQPGMVY